MKKSILLFAAIAMLASCQSGPEGETAQTSEKQEEKQAGGTVYTVDKTASVVSFIGSKPTGTHGGDFRISDGIINVENGNISGGNFTVDLNTLKITDKGMDSTTSGKLTGHLQSPDFFDVKKYPNAKFVITKAEARANDSSATHTISGNLTFKDSTKNVTFPAKVMINETSLTATADFNIDRTHWGLHYGNDKSLGDKFIYPEVKIRLNIKANK